MWPFTPRKHPAPLRLLQNQVDELQTKWTYWPKLTAEERAVQRTNLHYGGIMPSRAVISAQDVMNRIEAIVERLESLERHIGVTYAERPAEPAKHRPIEYPGTIGTVQRRAEP